MRSIEVGKVWWAGRGGAVGRSKILTIGYFYYFCWVGVTISSSLVVSFVMAKD